MFRITLAWKITFGDESFLEWWGSSTSSIGGEYEGFIFMSQQFNAPGPLAPCKSPRHASSTLRHRHPETIRKTSSWWGLWTNMCMCWLIHLSIPSFVHACIHSFTHSFIHSFTHSLTHIYIYIYIYIYHSLTHSINQSINQSIKRPSHHFQTTAGSSVSRPETILSQTGELFTRYLLSPKNWIESEVFFLFLHRHF